MFRHHVRDITGEAARVVSNSAVLVFIRKRTIDVYATNGRVRGDKRAGAWHPTADILEGSRI